MANIFIHNKAIVDTQKIGDRTRIWAFVHILENAEIGSDCNICEHVFIENDVKIGNRVTVKCGVQLWDGILLDDDVFVGPNATFSNDIFPRSKQYPPSYSRTYIKKGASVGANATILPGITVGQYAMIGAGAVVVNNVPPYAKVVGNPARIIGYVDTNTMKEIQPQNSNNLPNIKKDIDIKGVQLIETPLIKDLRGDLTFAEVGKTIPFSPKRYFIVNRVSTMEIRGEHAHRECHQLLICVSGACSVAVDDGQNRVEIRLDRPSLGIYIPPMIWARQYKFSPEGVLFVLASDIYKSEDYIREYDVFLAEINKP